MPAVSTTVKYTRVGRGSLLANAFGGADVGVLFPATVQLYTNSVTLTETITQANFVDLQDSIPYTAGTITPASWIVTTSGDIAVAKHPSIRVSITTDRTTLNANANVRGYYILGSDSTTVLWAGSFPSPFVVNKTPNGQIVDLFIPLEIQWRAP